MDEIEKANMRVEIAKVELYAAQDVLRILVEGSLDPSLELKSLAEIADWVLECGLDSKIEQIKMARNICRERLGFLPGLLETKAIFDKRWMR